MKTIGIITEFNPFHKGHEYLIQTAKEQTKADRVIVVMSGSFVQRGEPAIFDKWTRAEAALKNGADLVLELPILFATANAEIFARGAIRTLGETGLVDTLCFGSESGDLNTLKEATHIMTNETEEYRRLLKEYLNLGMSYPSARGKALERVSTISSNVLTQPNHILAIEYLMALDKYKYKIEPMTIQRHGSDYHSTSLKDITASATAIRKGLFTNNLIDQIEALSHVPYNCKVIYQQAIADGKAPISWNGLTDAINYKLRLLSAKEIEGIFEVTEGLENRILQSIKNGYSMDELVSFIKSKRYTRTKIQRILLHILLDIQASEVNYFSKKLTLPYIRVLGFQKEKADILGDLTLMSKTPILTNLKKAPDILDEDGLHLLSIEKLATDLHAMAYPDPKLRQPNLDFTNPLAMI